MERFGLNTEEGGAPMSNPYDLLEQQEDMEYGPERVGVTEEAVRLADLSGDGQASYDARMALMETAAMSGQSEKLFPAFAWCQHYAAQHPDEVDDHTLAWHHKWVLSAAHQFPQFPLSRIHELHGSYAQYARKLGAGARSSAYLQMKLAMHMGDPAAAQPAFNVWQVAKEDMLSDCSACEAQARAEYHVLMGDDGPCIKQGQLILKKKMSCGEIPHLTYGTLLQPLLRQGQRDLALQYAVKGRELVEGAPDFLSTQAEHLEFLALTDMSTGLEWYARHLPWAEQTRERRSQMDYHRAAALLFSRLEEEAVTLALSPEAEGWQQSGKYPVSGRLESHLAKARALATQFDKRNGTPHYTQKLARTLGTTGEVGL
ncbi:hypothetical protein E7T06_12580 [Deinococcus sp. Arct2-2]|uniref:hypothetical protein n=1 Tax=Deinococcus sp. Arct2-2 TaxID=2568653 RepID=UPI0010A3189D|nr:hypothetical protein [Deinococcus sp. Arct2-2]THF69318.1 hypothetical protein E7T06_12580 [Deinococcus sp. Arct2-2]